MSRPRRIVVKKKVSSPGIPEKLVKIEVEYQQKLRELAIDLLCKQGVPVEKDKSGYLHSSERLTVLVIDMGGNALRAVVWPPYTHSNIWNDGECVVILGAKVNKAYNQVVVNSDAVVIEDEAVTESGYPQEVAPLHLSSMQAQLPTAECSV